MRAHSTTDLESTDNGLTAFKRHRKASQQFTSLGKNHRVQNGREQALGPRSTAKRTKLCSDSIQEKPIYPAFSVTSRTDKFDPHVARPSLVRFLEAQADIEQREVSKTAGAREASNSESTASLAWNPEVATSCSTCPDASSKFVPTEHRTPSSMLTVGKFAGSQMSSEPSGSSAWVDYAQDAQYARHETDSTQSSLQVAVLYLMLLAYSIAKDPCSSPDNSKVSTETSSLVGSERILAPHDNEPVSLETIDSSMASSRLVLLTSPPSPVPRSLQRFRNRFTKRNASAHCNQLQEGKSVIPVVTTAKKLSLRYSKSHLHRRVSASTARTRDLSAIYSQSQRQQTQIGPKTVAGSGTVITLLRTSKELEVQVCCEHDDSFALCDDMQRIVIESSTSEAEDWKDRLPKTKSKTSTFENVVANDSSIESLDMCSSSLSIGFRNETSSIPRDCVLARYRKEAMSSKHKTKLLQSVCSSIMPKGFHPASFARPHDNKSDCYSKKTLSLTRPPESPGNRPVKFCSIGNAYTCLDNTALIQPIR